MSRRSTPPPEGAREIGVNVDRLRKVRGLTQTALGAAAGVSQQMVSAIVRGEKRPVPPLLAKLARVLGVTSDELMRAGPANSTVEENGTAYVDERAEWRLLYEQLTAEQRTVVFEFARDLRHR